jgi:signal transduction histidine kinase
MHDLISGEQVQRSFDASRPTFADVLRDACAGMASQWSGNASMLFLYDDIADAFSVVAAQGGLFGDIRGAVPSEEDAKVLASTMLDVQPVTADLHHPQTGSLLPCLLVPLWDNVPVGITAVIQDSPGRIAPNESMYTAARSAARRIRTARPDVDHACLFRDILDVDPGGIAVVEGADHVFSYATVAFRQVLTRDTVPFLGRSARDVMDQDTGYQGIALLDRVRDSREPFHVPQIEVTDAYGARYFELHLVPRMSGYEAEDAIYIILWPRTDVVLTRRALEASIHQLGDSQGLLSAVLDGTNNGILFTDREGIVQYANRRAGELLGLDMVRVVGHHGEDVIHELKQRMADPDIYEQRAHALLGLPEAQLTDELELVRPVRCLIDRYSAPVYSEGGNLLGRVEVYSDVTETRDLQRSKDDFLSLVSHELKTPVTSIKGYSQLLKRRADRENLSEGILNACTVIERQVERMEGLISTLLDLSRLETSQMDLNIERVDVRALVLRVSEMVQLTEDTHVIDLNVPSEAVWIEADAGRVEQVLMNLLTNAVRFSATGTTVSVSLRDDEQVVLQVVDEGQGIPAAMQPHIFERFYRGGNIQQSNGMGIGLYITRGIVEQHGGTIEVHSTAGEGASFTVRLPRTQPPSDFRTQRDQFTDRN